MAPRRYIYSEELGLERVTTADIEDIAGNATVVIAVLARGVNRPPLRIREIERIYCPECQWLQPEAAHSADCRYIGARII